NPEGFLTSIVYDIYENNKTLWIGTDRGLKQLNTDNQQQQSFYISPLLAKEDLPLVKKVIANSEVDNKKIWLIPQKPYAGLVLYNLKNQKIIKEWNTTKTTKGKIYSDIIHSKNESIIIASRDSGLDFFTEKKGLIKTIKLTEKINCIVEDTFGNLWLGTDDGLIFFNNKTNISTKFQSTFTGSDVEKNAFGGEFPISDLKIGVDNKIWLTNSKYGLFSFDIITKKFTSHRQNANSKFSTLDRCSSVTIVSKDSIWFGNMAGLSCYVPSQNKFINFDVTKGLKSTYIYSIIKDAANNIWARGNADVFYFNTNSKKIISTILNPSCNIFSYKQKLNISGNSIFLGHEAGFTIFDANNFVKPITAKPLLKIISYKSNIGNVFVPNENNFAPIKLNYNDNQIGFEYAAIEYNNPEEIEYWHRLEGLEKEFISSADNRVVDYTNLPHGKYRFTVYAINKHTNIKSELAFLNFTIQPAFWQRWWFWPVLALFFVMLVVSFAQKRITTIRQKEKQKTAVNKAMAELETKMFRSQMNPHFIFNSLNSIQKYIWENKEEDAAEYLAQFAKLIRAILENSRKETVLLKEEIEVMKLYIDLEHRRSNANFDYSIKVNEDIDLQNVAIPPLLLQPFIENAIWHGLSKKQKKGNLNINITKNNNQLICVIDDDGVGRQDFNNNTEKKSVGIEITKQRIDKLMEMTKQYANVTIFDKNENGEPLGTKVIITLPLQICES
ncbi:MAG: histidine kinase, partial [Ferruginibacter sp.]